METLHAAERLERAIAGFEPGASLVRRWPLRGGISARLTAFEIERPGGERQKLIARQPAAVWFAEDPQVAAKEFRLLEVLKLLGLPVPAPRFLEAAGETMPESLYVVEYVEGEPEFNPASPADFLERYARQLARIHQVDVSDDRLDFLPRPTRDYAPRPAVLNDAMREAEIRDALENAPTRMRSNAPVLRHGDYWPGNVLWRDGEIAALIDWENARIGEPLADLAVARLDVLWVLGMDAMAKFTRVYASETALDLTDLPYWDLCAALRIMNALPECAVVYPGLGRPDITEASMRAGHGIFVDGALAEFLP